MYNSYSHTAPGMSSMAYNNFCNPLCQALKSRNIDAIREALINKNISLNLLDPCGYIPLHFAIQLGGNAEIVKLLIDAGANINLKASHDGKTPLERALTLNSREITKQLIDAGADLKQITELGYTILHNIITKCSLDAAKLIVESGADVNCKTACGKTLLHFAAFCYNSEVVEYLLSQGINVNEKDNFGRTPLHYVAFATAGKERGNAYVLQTSAYNFKLPSTVSNYAGPHTVRAPTIDILLKNGADIYAKDYAGETPLDALSKSLSDKVVNSFLNHLSNLKIDKKINQEDEVSGAKEKESEPAQKVLDTTNNPKQIEPKSTQKLDESKKPSEEVEKKESFALMDMLKEIKLDIAESRKEQSENIKSRAGKDKVERLEQKMEYFEKKLANLEEKFTRFMVKEAANSGFALVE